MDILDPDVAYSEPTSIRERAILAIWIILCICLGLGGFLFAVSIPVDAAEINPSVDTIPFQCRFEYTKWLCDDKAGPAGAKGINGTPGTPGAGNFSAIYYNASNFTAYQNTTLIFGNITTGNNTINSNYTVIQGASFYNTTAINESYAYLPGRAGGQTLTGGINTGENLILNASLSPSVSSTFVLLQPRGGRTCINCTSPNTELQVYGISRFVGGKAVTVDWQLNSLSMGHYLGTPYSWIQAGGESDATWLRINPIGGVTGVGSGGLTISGITPTTKTAQFDTTGTVRFRNYGAGTATFDSGGNLTSVSDSKAKTNILPFTSALSAVKALEPKFYHYSLDSGLDTKNTYIGFIAQDVEKVIPDAVKTKEDTKEIKDSKGETVEVKTGTTTKSIDDRAIIATLVNALKELDAKNQALEARIKVLEDKVKS